MASKVSVPTSTVTCGCATGGGEHDQAVALGHISHWSRAALAALGPSSREQEQGCVFELPTDFAPICTELLNQAAIVVVHLSYGPSCYRCRPRRQLPYSVRCALFSSKLSGVSVSKDEHCTLREAHVWAWAGH